MEKYQNRGQGTLNSIVMLVLLFLLIDIAIALIMYFDVKLEDIFSGTDNTERNVAVTIMTDNTAKTDNN